MEGEIRTKVNFACHFLTGKIVYTLPKSLLSRKILRQTVCASYHRHKQRISLTNFMDLAIKAICVGDQFFPEFNHGALVEQFVVGASLIFLLQVFLPGLFWDKSQRTHHLRNNCLLRRIRLITFRSCIISSSSICYPLAEKLKQVYLDVTQYLDACTIIVKLFIRLLFLSYLLFNQT